MNETNKKRISKFLSLVLRHQPEHIGLNLDKNGWAKVNELIEKSKTKHILFSFPELEAIVVTNDKQRFAFNADKTKIRANQGHSLMTIDLQLEAIQPPEFLYHGTVAKFIDSIRTTGLEKRSRQHVHLSEDRDTATKVGSRRGLPIILSIKSLEMHNKGHEFYRSENNVWLTDHVPVAFIEFQ
ncbi:RNA 2'-phosphotransferase [Winogradskyella sp.]|uniref:RNA 2'-phosphotransferase n=1 Tax=Winogradskyella sp. TaxID=1883156 RepID=UPI003BAB887F